MTESDEELVNLVQGGDQAAFGHLVERYGDKITRYARRFLFGYEDAEDLVQQVFIKAYINIQSFDIKKKFSPWLYRIAHNEFLNAIKRKRKEALPFFDPDTLFPHPAAAETTDHDVLKAELKEALEASLDKLSAKYRETLVLYFYEDLTYDQIADVLQIPIATVGVRLRRGKEKLRILYDQIHPQYD